MSFTDSLQRTFNHIVYVMTHVPLSQEEKDFFKAIEKGDVEGVKNALKAAPPLAHSKTGFDSPAIVQAAVCKQPEILELLIKGGADINAQDRLGMTALMQSAMRDDRVSAKILIKHNADIQVEDKQHRTAIETAAHFNHFYLAERLESTLMAKLSRENQEFIGTYEGVTKSQRELQIDTRVIDVEAQPVTIRKVSPLKTANYAFHFTSA